MEDVNTIRQNDELILDILKRNYYSEFVKKDSSKNIELIINRTNVKSKCYGCFNNTETKMYPHIDFSETDYDKIYNHLSAFMKYYDKQGWSCPIELNGIDWSNDEVCEKILIMLQALSCKTIYNFPTKIIIDTDFNGFVNDISDLQRKWRRRYELFKKAGINLFFNIHANGKYCDDNNYGDDYWEQLIFWINSFHLDQNSYKIISYVRPNNIKNWINNYDWWVEKMGDNAFTHIELREEKTESWSYELINEYVLFLKHQVEVIYNRFGEEILTKIAFDKYPEFIFQNISILENKYLLNKKKNNNCNFFKNLTIDLTTMNIVPCAKVNYEDFSCGQYIIENNNITSIKAKNIPIIIFNTHLKQSCMPHCENCEHIEFCSGHCLGESYNKCYEMLVPIKEFCDLSKAKINFLIYLYIQLGILTEENLNKLNCNELYIKYLLQLADSIQEI